MDKDKLPQDSEVESPQKAPVDLSALQGFDFGTNWSESKPRTSDSRSFDRNSRQGDRRPRGDNADRKDRRPFKPGSFRKPPRQEEGDRGDRPPRQGGGPSRRPADRHDAPPKKVIEVSFYPEDNGLKAICKALRISTITYELFEITRTILEKEERFYLVIQPEGPAVEGVEPCLYVAESDGLPFMSEESAKQHAMANCLEHFFTTETKEVEPPSGSFSTIRKCGITGELLGPPNFHKIQKIMADHHATRLSNMPYARFESRIESVSEEEVIAEWLEKMKTQTTYTLKPEFGEPRVFEDGETARAYVHANLSGKMVSKHNSVKLEGTQISKVKDPLIKANLDFAWERQKRFPLDSANLLRGRLRRQKFALYKKGSKGVSYVCAVKRRFRDPDQVFSEPVEKLLEFLENNPGIAAKAMPEKYLGFIIHAVEGEAAPELTSDQQAKLKAMSLDFQWLLKEGYIAEYSDGTVFANPVAGPGQSSEAPKSKKKSTPEKLDPVATAVEVPVVVEEVVPPSAVEESAVAAEDAVEPVVSESETTEESPAVVAVEEVVEQATEPEPAIEAKPIVEDTVPEADEIAPSPDDATSSVEATSSSAEEISAIAEEEVVVAVESEEPVPEEIVEETEETASVVDDPIVTEESSPEPKVGEDNEEVEESAKN
jgi:hypothetical protein